MYFGANAYGVQAAAQRIIGEPLAQLDLGDAALLAGLIKDPIHYDPFVHPDGGAAPARRRAAGDAAPEEDHRGRGGVRGRASRCRRAPIARRAERPQVRCCSSRTPCTPKR